MVEVVVYCRFEKFFLKRVKWQYQVELDRSALNSKYDGSPSTLRVISQSVDMTIMPVNERRSRSLSIYNPQYSIPQMRPHYQPSYNLTRIVERQKTDASYADHAKYVAAQFQSGCCDYW
ncbi:hypothetical protein DINM_002590 [Dirofilaria immitis]|nr:hypothetical protein [Dirofilaria immitis]